MTCSRPRRSTAPTASRPSASSRCRTCGSTSASALLGSIYVLQTFDQIFTITQGGPGSATTNLPYEIYLTMFRKYEYGEAAAAGVVVVIGTIVVATFALRTIRPCSPRRPPDEHHR